MVYLHFPTGYSEEETMLQTKFEKLKRKKKALHNLKAPKSEPERVTPVKKPPIEVRDAREFAKKLIRSGAIATIQKTPKRDELAGFKRPSGLERKLEKSVSGYQPFSANYSSSPVLPQPTPFASEENELEKPKKRLYSSFVSSREKDDAKAEKKEFTREAPKQGHTIFVSGHKITEEFLRKTFHECGNIVNVNMELEKNRGFVTFEKMQSAEMAISDFNGSCVSDVNLKVSYARRQPAVPPVSDTATNTIWGSQGPNPPQKRPAPDSRDQVFYGDINF